jgi:hypothetical protein
MSDGLNDAQKLLLLEELVRIETERANTAEVQVEALKVTVDARQSEVPF